MSERHPNPAVGRTVRANSASFRLSIPLLASV
jgi:hypothetical protein